MYIIPFDTCLEPCKLLRTYGTTLSRGSVFPTFAHLCMHACMFICIFLHTLPIISPARNASFANACMHACTYSHIQECIPMHACTYTHIQECIPHIHASSIISRTHSHLIKTYTYTHKHIICIHASSIISLAHIRTSCELHTHINTHIHTKTHTLYAYTPLP